MPTSARSGRRSSRCPRSRRTPPAPGSRCSRSCRRRPSSPGPPSRSGRRRRRRGRCRTPSCRRHRRGGGGGGRGRDRRGRRRRPRVGRRRGARRPLPDAGAAGGAGAAPRASLASTSAALAGAVLPHSFAASTAPRPLTSAEPFRRLPSSAGEVAAARAHATGVQRGGEGLDPLGLARDREHDLAARRRPARAHDRDGEPALLHAAGDGHARGSRLDLDRLRAGGDGHGDLPLGGNRDGTGPSPPERRRWRTGGWPESGG